MLAIACFEFTPCNGCWNLRNRALLRNFSIYWKLFAQGNRVVLSLRERALARAGLDVEELLSLGYIAVEDLELKQDLDSLDWEDLLWDQFKIQNCLGCRKRGKIQNSEP